MSSAKGLADWYSPYEVGTGRLDVAAAVRNTRQRHRLAVLRQLRLAARADRRRRHQGPGLHQPRRRRRHAEPGARPAPAARSPSARPRSPCPPAARRPSRSPATRRPSTFGRHVGYVVGTDAATGQPVTRTSRGADQGGRALRPHDQAGRPRRQAGRRLGRRQHGRRLLAVDACTSRADHDAHAARHLRGHGTYLDVAGERPDRSGLAVLVDPETVLDRRRRGRAGREQGAPAADRGAAAHRGPPAQGGLQHRLRRLRHGVPQRVRRPAGVRRHLRLADRADDRRASSC